MANSALFRSLRDKSLPVLLEPPRLAFNYRSFLLMILSLNFLSSFIVHQLAICFLFGDVPLLNVPFSLYHKLCYLPFKSFGVTLSLGEYHWSTGVTFFLFSFLSSTRRKFFSFLLHYRFSFYHTFVNLVNSSSLLITHCNLLCSFHRTCTIFGQVNLNKSWSSEACLIVLHRVVDARRSQCAPRANHLGLVQL